MRKCQEPDCNVLGDDIFCQTHAPLHTTCRVGTCNRARLRHFKFCDAHFYLKENWNDTFCNIGPGCTEPANTIRYVNEPRPCPDHERKCAKCDWFFAIRWEHFCPDCICQFPECHDMRDGNWRWCRQHKCRTSGCGERRYTQPEVAGGMTERYCYNHFLAAPRSEWELLADPGPRERARR